ncbi:alpha/beta-hydrolase [Phlegmacium glaucopus]|nr:alpha/beta-hydrolase [Phlegmacium glaucopus]
MSKESHLIGGIQTNVYKASNIQPRSVAILFLLHGRHGSAGDVDPVARRILAKNTGDEQQQLWIVTLDHRNHGQRLLDAKANNAWTETVSNNLHAMDMYSIQTGTAQDVSFLIDFIPAYFFPHDDCKVDTWGVAGISLGGHSTWIALSTDPRITLGIPIIGCPNYIELLKHRAHTSDIAFQAPHIPNSLITLINKSDPAFKNYKSLDSSNPFLGKKVLVLSGKEDPLVPWSASEGFVDALEVGPEGVKKVFVQEGVKHACTKEMVEEAASFVGQYMLTTAPVPASL